MRLISKLFAGPTRYLRLSEESPAAKVLRGVEVELTALLGSADDVVEVVPAQGKAFVFVGSPPTRFGFAWVTAGLTRRLQDFVSEHRLDPPRERRLVAALAQAYSHGLDTQRYRASLAGHSFLVTPSATLALELDKILHRASTASRH